MSATYKVLKWLILPVTMRLPATRYAVTHRGSRLRFNRLSNPTWNFRSPKWYSTIPVHIRWRTAAADFNSIGRAIRPWASGHRRGARRYRQHIRWRTAAADFHSIGRAIRTWVSGYEEVPEDTGKIQEDVPQPQTSSQSAEQSPKRILTSMELTNNQKTMQAIKAVITYTGTIDKDDSTDEYIVENKEARDVCGVISCQEEFFIKCHLCVAYTCFVH